MKHALLMAFALLASTATVAIADSPEWMAEDCASAAQSFFQDFEAKAELQYQGKRTDGTHALKGTIYLETRSDNIQCSYDAEATAMVGFFAEGKSWPGFVKEGITPHKS